MPDEADSTKDSTQVKDDKTQQQQKKSKLRQRALSVLRKTRYSALHWQKR